MQQATRMMWNGTVRALPLKQQLHAASVAGCTALSATPGDYNRWLGGGVSTRDMLAMADDAGVRTTHLDPFVRWIDRWRPELPGEDFPTDWLAFEADDFFRMAAALRVESFTAWGGFPVGTYDTAQLTDAFGALCRRADQEGLRCGLEFIPVFGIPDLRTAWDIVRGAAAVNGGIIFDFWHYMRGGRDDALLRSIPGGKIMAVQLCDATAEVPGGMSLAFDGLNNRRLPGDGDFPIDEIVSVLRESDGFHNVGLEVFSLQFDAMSAQAIGEVSRRSLDQMLHADNSASGHT